MHPGERPDDVVGGERERLIAQLDAERTQLTRLAAEAQAANRAKTTFLATMSHELRTPLNAILGYTELMELGLAGEVSEVQRTYHERVRQSARHLLGLISEVLDLAKVESGQLVVQRERVQPHREAASALALVRPQAAARRLRLSERAACDDALEACGDGDRVRQILLNLLTNAVKFTPEDGTVVLECGRADDHVWLRVVDTGIGIPASQLEQIFQPFVQASDDATSPYRRTQGGTGLGLAISRQLARLMGGDLVAESTPGMGSTFTLCLPPWEQTARVPRFVRHAQDDSVPRHVRLALGETLAACADHITKTWADRLRADPDVPLARDRPAAEVEDHVGAFLADFAQHFAIIDEQDANRTALVRDGVAIQQVIATLHGAQRARLQWTEASVRRELALLADEVERTLREQLGSVGAHDDALALVRAMLRASAQDTLAAFRTARLARDAA
jgi:signal transduction histidine kinase